jgi:hypothetical protein
MVAWVGDYEKFSTVFHVERYADLQNRTVFHVEHSVEMLPRNAVQIDDVFHVEHCGKSAASRPQSFSVQCNVSLSILH